MENKRQIDIGVATAEEKGILKNLLALYLHDLSEFTDNLNINEEGLFEYDALEMYYDHESLIPLLFKIDEEYAGFILLNKSPYAPKDLDYYINEFFILKKYRRKGLAEAVIKKLFISYSGSYYVAQLKSNIPAIKFWHKLYDNSNINYIENDLLLDNEECIAQRFKI